MITKIYLQDVLELYKVPEIKITCITTDTITGSVLFYQLPKLCRICFNKPFVLELNGFETDTRLYFKIKDSLPF